MSGRCRRCGGLGAIRAGTGVASCPQHGCIAAGRLERMTELVDAAWRDGGPVPSLPELEAFIGVAPSEIEHAASPE